MRLPLAGRGIVITRPAGESGNLAQLVREAGGEPIVCPAIVIEPIADTAMLAKLNELIDRLDHFDLAIFVSPSAVERGMAHIRARRVFPPALRCAAIGAGGAHALVRHGVTQVLAPNTLDIRESRADSEALLAMPYLHDIVDQCMVIFRGEGGRELLSETLRVRGARVEHAVCYRRGKPIFDPAPLLAAWRAARVHALIATSSEGLRNFHTHVGASGAELLRDTPLVVPHPRIAEAARDLGLRRVVESASGDNALIAALTQHLAAHHSGA